MIHAKLFLATAQNVRLLNESWHANECIHTQVFRADSVAAIYDTLHTPQHIFPMNKTLSRQLMHLQTHTHTHTHRKIQKTLLF